MDPEMREALDQLGTDLRGEIRSGDTQTREALNQLALDLRGEIRSGDTQTREALNQLALDLRGEIRSGDAETRAYIDDRIQTSTASFLHAMGEFETRMRRHFDVVGDSLRSDLRAVVEGMAASREQVDRRLGEETGRTDGLEGRVLRLEVRVKGLEDAGKPRRPRRGR